MTSVAPLTTLTHCPGGENARLEGITPLALGTRKCAAGLVRSWPPLADSKKKKNVATRTSHPVLVQLPVEALPEWPQVMGSLRGLL